MSLVRGRSLVYMRSKSSLICVCVALPNETWWSTRPGRMSASSSFSGRLVVITRTRPSWDATPVFESVMHSLFENLGISGEGR